jgi:hypothetical protein
MRLVLVLVIGAACSSSSREPKAGPGSASGSASAPTGVPTTVQRTADRDSFCEPPNPEAYDYPDQTTAEAAGCKVRRVYGSEVDEKTGATRDREMWFYCCPKR